MDDGRIWTNHNSSIVIRQSAISLLMADVSACICPAAANLKEFPAVSLRRQGELQESVRDELHLALRMHAHDGIESRTARSYDELTNTACVVALPVW
jgi:hypothetical protein